MEVPIPAKHPALSNSLHLAGFGDSGWEVSAGDTVLPLTSRSLRQTWNGRFGGLSASVAALAAIAAVAVAYVVFHCTLNLGRANRSRAAPRFLSAAKGNRNKGTGEFCGAPEEDPPAAAVATVEGEEEEETLDKDELLGRSRRYASKLTTLVKESISLLLQLSPELRATCTTMFLCLPVSELSALLSLLEMDEREGMKKRIGIICDNVWIIRNSIPGGSLSPTQQRHIKCLHAMLLNLKQIQPNTSGLTETQRLQKIHKLLQLQETALGHVSTGLEWLKESVERSKEANGDARGAAEPAEGAAAPAEGAAADSGSVASAAESAAAASEVAVAVAKDRHSAIVSAIVITIHKRRDQVLQDARLSAWLREAQPRGHFSITTAKRLEALARKPQTHSQLMEALQATPLGSGDKSRVYAPVEDIDAQHGNASSSDSKDPSREGLLPPAEDPSHASRAAESSKPRHRRSRKGAKTAKSAPASASPSTSTDVTASAAPAGRDEGKHAVLRAPSHHTPMPDIASSNALSQAWPPAGPCHPQVSALSADSNPAAAVPTDHRTPAIWASNVFGSTSVGGSWVASSPGASSWPLPSSFGGAVSVSSVYPWRAPGVSSQTPVAYPTLNTLWVSEPAHGASSAFGAPHALPAASAPLLGRSDRAPGGIMPRREAPFPSIPQPHPTPTLPYSYAAAGGPSSLRTTRSVAVPRRGAGEFVSGPSSSPLQAPAPQTVRIASSGPAGSRSSPKGAKPQGPIGVDGGTHTVRILKRPSTAAQRPAAEISPKEDLDKASPPTKDV